MSGSTPAPSTNFFGVVPHPSEPRVLLLPGAAGWSLPHTSLDRPIWVAHVSDTNAALGELLGTRVTTLRYLSHDASADGQITTVFVLETHNPSWEPPAGAVWFGRAELADLPLAHPEHRALVGAYLTEVEHRRVPELRTPWARAGWFAEAAAWIEAELAQLGRPLTAPVEQAKSWGLSCLLRAETTVGSVFFKVANSRPLFAHEPLLMRELAARFPDHIPAPLSVDAGRRWMLLSDFGKPVGWSAPIEVQETMLRCFAGLQRDIADSVDELLAMGCLDRRLDKLAAQIDPLLADTDLLASQLDGEEIERLRALAPRLKEDCARLAGYAIPQTLVHGDLHLDNVARVGDRFLFFDWTDGCVAHPFFDTISIYYNEEGVQERLRASYLSAWASYETPERLREAWELAKPLCALHQAVSYRAIVNNLEETTRHECASGLPFWIRKLLTAIENTSA